MRSVKYTREMLSEAVAASTSMAGVLRHLGLRLNGGAHAHLRRRIDQLGIDTSHFLGRAHSRGAPSPRRRPADRVLVVRPVDARRENPAVLKRALLEIGHEYRCAECGTGDRWNERPLTLHIDHIDGQFWDCRPDNLRFLCPNCHTQTSTYAGRNRSRSTATYVRVDAHGNPIADPDPAEPLSEQERIAVLRLAERGEMTITDAGRTLGCSRSHVYHLQRRLSERGSLDTPPRRPRIPEWERQAVIAAASAHPTLGLRRLAAELRTRPDAPVTIAPSSIDGILKATGRSMTAAAEQSGTSPTV